MVPKTLIVIPARGGSKGVPRKNLRLLGGRPLIHHCLQTALSVADCTTVVTTEDEEIITVAEQLAPHIIKRPAALSEDDITLDDVVVHAVTASEDMLNQQFDKIITIQPTSPFVTADTIRNAIAALDDADTAMSVCDDRHLRWTESEGQSIPLFSERLNRQWMDPCWVENGGIIACRREMIGTGTRIGENVTLLKVDAKEGHDIDTHLDWALAEALVSTPNVAFRVIGDEKRGLGHVFRALTLADRLASKPLFITEPGSELARDLIQSRHHQVVHSPTSFADNSDTILNSLKNHEIDIIVNDVLDTTEADISVLKSAGFLVVNIEDMGSGSATSDLTINALYEHENPLPNQRYGWPWVCLREEFLYGEPNTSVGTSILATFGGTDPRNLTAEVIQHLANRSDADNLHLTVILGPGNPRVDEITSFCNSISTLGSLTLLNSVPRMSDHMRAADIAITSNGRTVYELAACGTPMITISQNSRENLHTFSNHCEGAHNLGFTEAFPSDAFDAAFSRLISNPELRTELSKALLAYDLASGTDRVISELTRLHRSRTGGI